MMRPDSSGRPGGGSDRNAVTDTSNLSGAITQRPTFRSQSAPQGRPVTSVGRSPSQNSSSPPPTPRTPTTPRTPNTRFPFSYTTPTKMRNASATGQNMNTTASPPTMRNTSRSYPTVQNNQNNWIFQQDRKIRITGIPLGTGPRSVYQQFEGFGRIIRIEVVRDAAYVTFQPPPTIDVYRAQIFVDGAKVRIEETTIRRFPVSSPVDQRRIYHETNILRATSIDFGITLTEKTLDIMQNVCTKDIQVALHLGERKELDLQFPLTIDGCVRRLRFRLPLSLIGHIFQIKDHETQACELVIPFDSAPQFFMQSKIEDMARTFHDKDKVWIDWYSWYRQTDVVDAKTKDWLKTAPVMNHYDEVILDIGRWTTYRVSFDSASTRGPQFKDFIDGLVDYGVHVQVLDEYCVRQGRSSPIPSLLEEEIFGTHPQIKPSAIQESTSGGLFTSRIHLSFSIRYQLEACLSNGYIKEHSITQAFLERILSMDEQEAVCLLEKVADRQRVYLDPLEIFTLRRKREPRKIPGYCVLSRSANITPTMIHVSTPVVETSNRIIRKHEADADRFIRVKFSDEQTEGRIFSQDDERSDAIFERVERAMREGIVVAGRYYEFLAFGNSQFREHGAYFYAPTSSKSSDQIRQSMGQFEHIKTAAKYGARLGQCFSTTRAIKSINVKIEMIPDVERNGFVFTDGVGRISLFLAQMAAKELGLQNPFDDPPSLYQFRLGGCKGVLALDPKINGSVVHIRPSQYKFEAQNVGLEIIRASALAVACFNRQLIIILSALGVPDMMFIRKQQEMVNYLERATKEESVALEKLQCNIDLNQTSLTMAGMILDGFMKHQDPFMMSLLQLWRAYHIKTLKEKARILIEDGAFVLGCVDETAILRGHFDDAGAELPQIFLQISNHKGQYKVVEGKCILARNPSLHCGDIRVVQAVDVPALHHLKNVVVLPQTGDRDLANMCSGGDLDGDDYIVLWDPRFIPTVVNEPPMDFTPDKPTESDQPITVQDITKFFVGTSLRYRVAHQYTTWRGALGPHSPVMYMKRDTLSRIATAHLAQADFAEEGVRDEKCLELAKRHSQAVDYPKSGIPATMSRDLRPKKYPHFMVSKYRLASKTYKSNKILGKLFDQVELVDFKPVYGPFDDRILTAFQLGNKILGKAREMKSSYDSALLRLMAKHAIKTEFEAWSVFVMSHNQEGRDYTFAEEFGKTIGVLKDQHRQLCRDEVELHIDFSISTFVAAMYTVTAKEVDEAHEECSQTKIVGGKTVPVREPTDMPLISFPWLFVNELGKIATEFAGTKRQTLLSSGVAPSSKQRKQVDTSTNLTGNGNPDIGNIETFGGEITRYGELLTLDFSLGKEADVGE